MPIIAGLLRSDLSQSRDFVNLLDLQAACAGAAAVHAEGLEAHVLQMLQATCASKGSTLAAGRWHEPADLLTRGGTLEGQMKTVTLVA